MTSSSVGRASSGSGPMSESAYAAPQRRRRSGAPSAARRRSPTSTPRSASAANASAARRWTSLCASPRQSRSASRSAALGARRRRPPARRSPRARASARAVEQACGMQRSYAARMIVSTSVVQRADAEQEAARIGVDGVDHGRDRRRRERAAAQALLEPLERGRVGDEVAGKQHVGDRRTGTPPGRPRARRAGPTRWRGGRVPAAGDETRSTPRRAARRPAAVIGSAPAAQLERRIAARTTPPGSGRARRASRRHPVRSQRGDLLGRQHLGGDHAVAVDRRDQPGKAGPVAVDRQHRLEHRRAAGVALERRRARACAPPTLMRSRPG